VIIHSQTAPPVQAETIQQIDSTAKLLPSQMVRHDDSTNSININLLDHHLLEAAIKLSEFLPGEISLVYTSEHGLGWQAEQGWQTFIGFDLENIDEKMALYDNIVTYLSGQNITPGMVDIEYIHAPFYRMERLEW
jgi:hypothetical protein